MNGNMFTIFSLFNRAGWGIYARVISGDEVLQWNGKLLPGATMKEVYNIILESQAEPQVELVVSRPIGYVRNGTRSRQCCFSDCRENCSPSVLSRLRLWLRVGRPQTRQSRGHLFVFWPQWCASIQILKISYPLPASGGCQVLEQEVSILSPVKKYLKKVGR